MPPGWLGLTNESGLVLSDDDGDFLLTPTEIIDLNFNSDIVLLSSCNSDNDGVDSLYKSFLVAGVIQLSILIGILKLYPLKILHNLFLK